MPGVIKVYKIVIERPFDNVRVSSFRHFLFSYLISMLLCVLLIIQCNYQTVKYSNELVKLKNADPPSAFLEQIRYIEKQLEMLEFFQRDIEVKIDLSIKRYDADKIGVYDYAAQYAGGSIISTPDTEPLIISNKTLGLFGAGLTLNRYSHPYLLLQPFTQPGQCFAFKGQTGRIRIKLGKTIRIKSVTIEHSLLGNEQSAVKDFSVFSLKNDADEQGENLGNFTFDLRKIIETFLVENIKMTQFVELTVNNNYGGDYTCIYRFRVHSV